MEDIEIKECKTISSFSVLWNLVREINLETFDFYVDIACLAFALPQIGNFGSKQANKIQSSRSALQLTMKNIVFKWNMFQFGSCIGKVFPLNKQSDKKFS